MASFLLQGNIAAATAGELRRVLAGAARETAVLLDLTGVTFIDQVGLGVLLGTVRAVRDNGGRVAIAEGDPRRGLTRTLRAAGADRLVHLAASPANALEWLAAPSDERHLAHPRG